MEIPRLITILGPTAVGKTRLAAMLAAEIKGEIISADSRQVFRGMTVGTGKDLSDYLTDKGAIPYHIIDVADPDEEFHVFRFKKLFIEAASDIMSRGNQVIMCGGTGLYLDAVLRDYFFVEVPENPLLRASLEKKSTEQLAELLTSLKKVHNKTDLTDRQRLLRAIEICYFHSRVQENDTTVTIPDSRVFGLTMPREMVRKKIAERLERRIEEGMTAEVKQLLNSGISSERLISFGLEYKYVTLYLLGRIEFTAMQQQLCTAIQQFSKRQMSWFRRMERLGVNIEWIDGTLNQESRLQIILDKLNK